MVLYIDNLDIHDDVEGDVDGRKLRARVRGARGTERAPSGIWTRPSVRFQACFKYDLEVDLPRDPNYRLSTIDTALAVNIIFSSTGI